MILSRVSISNTTITLLIVRIVETYSYMDRLRRMSIAYREIRLAQEDIDFLCALHCSYSGIFIMSFVCRILGKKNKDLQTFNFQTTQKELTKFYSRGKNIRGPIFRPCKLVWHVTWLKALTCTKDTLSRAKRRRGQIKLGHIDSSKRRCF